MSELNVIELENTKNDLLWEFARFKTFSKWPFKSNAKCLATNMSAAGWYCTSFDPEDPSAKCAFCFKELNGWEATDDPWLEHIKHSENCILIKIGKQEKDCTVVDMYRLLEARMLKIVEMQYHDDISKLNEIKDQFLVEFNRMAD